MPDSGELQSVINRLENVKSRGKSSYTARCPAHQDRTASLSVSQGEHGVVLHCLAADTRVLTKSGARPIGDLSGDSHTLLVPSLGVGRSEWKECEVKSFGFQPTRAITISRLGSEKTIRATVGHRWFVQSRGSAPVIEKTTDELRRGDRLKSILPSRRNTVVAPFGVAHGFVFGDGSASSYGSHAQFCGPKDSALLKYFPAATAHKYGEVTRISGLPLFFKKPPSLDESPAYLLGWLAGYFAADGCVDSKGNSSIASAKREHLQAFRDIATRLGICTYPIRKQSRRGYGLTDSDLFTTTMPRSDLFAEFFIIPTHRRRWELATKDGIRYDSWRVKSIAEEGPAEEVFCAIVPGPHAFALEDWILTGNCFAGCETDDVLGAIGLTMSDLFPPRERAAMTPAERSQARLAAQQAGWSAALTTLAQDTLLVQACAGAILKGQALFPADHDALTAAATRIHNAKEVLCGRR